MTHRRMLCRIACALFALAVNIAAGQTIPLDILEPPQRVDAVKDYPATVGAIFLEGEITSAPGGAVVDDRGRAVPFEWEVTGWWNESKDSVKWLLLHFNADSDRRYSFVLGGQPANAAGKPLAVETGGGITINTGPLQARLEPGNATAFTTVSLKGRPILARGESFFEMVDDEGRPLACDDWKLTLEQSTPMRAVVKADGVMRAAGEKPLAMVSVRYHFFAGEGFVRMYHTFIWMPRSLDPGASHIGLRLRPALGDRGVVRVGRSDYTADAHEMPFDPGADIAAYQDDVDHYTVTKDGSEIATGDRLGGWIALEDETGRGIGVSLKNAWQTYPTTLAVRKGDIDIGMWPREAGRFSFEEREIMPDPLYYSDYWKYRAPWAKHGGPANFGIKDLEAEHAVRLFTDLKAQFEAAEDSPGKRIVSRLRPELQKRIADYQPGAPVSDGFRARIAHGMNAFLTSRDFYHAPSWQNVELKAKAKELLDKGIDSLDEPNVKWLNRLLIESAWPGAVSPTDIPHHIHENDPFARGGGYVPHGQGASRTHEITVLFYDRASQRTAAQVNSLTQHPFVMRQSPKFAMRAPFFGFKFSPRDPQKYPDIERSLDLYGHANFARYPETCDYGFHRFGMQHMNYPGDGLYRWHAGMQYDQQIIPWLLFVRGGDRRYYEEAMNVTTFAMDMQTNHYNTVGAPTGYMAFVASMPFPEGTTFSAYNMKIHFLAMCHHLTGYKRADEVIDMAVKGVKKIYPGFLERGIPIGRQLYGMDMFCAHAYNETLDPEMKQLARASLDHTLATHYDPQSNTFYGNTQYLYRGLLSLYEIFPEPHLRDVMLKHLAGMGMPGLELGGVATGRAGVMVLGSAWAYEQTGDERYARIIWDVARSIADVSPEHDWTSTQVVEYPLGHFANYAHRVLPMLVALGLVDRHDFSFPETNSLHDLFVSINQPGATGDAYLRATRDGDLHVKIDRRRTGGEEIEVIAFRLGGDEPVARSTASTTTTEPFTDLRRSRKVSVFECSMTIPNAKRGDVFRLSAAGGDPYMAMLLLCDDAQIVHQIKTGQNVQFFGHSQQYFVGTRVYVKMADDTLKIHRFRSRAGYLIRDANTREVILRSSVTDPVEMEYNIGKGRMIEIVLTGATPNYWKIEGIEPYVAGRLQDWFSPREESNH